MEKPELDKVIGKLENLDVEQWEWKHGYHGPEFVTNDSGLTFCVSVCMDTGFLKDEYYHSLYIQNRDKSVTISYYHEQKVSQLYEKIYAALRKSREEEFKEVMDNFLSE